MGNKQVKDISFALCLKAFLKARRRGVKDKRPD